MAVKRALSATGDRYGFIGNYWLRNWKFRFMVL